MTLKKIPWSGIFFTIVLIGFVARYFYKKPDVDPGEMAPAFSGVTITGSAFQLNDLKGKIVLIDFWGSWCGPCRGENPHLVALYKKYQNKTFKDASGFEVVSIGIENNEARWKRAIQSDQLIWPYHIMDKVNSFKFFDAPIANSYGVREVPSKFLLNPELQTIGVNQSINEIDTWLAEQVK